MLARGIAIVPEPERRPRDANQSEGVERHAPAEMGDECNSLHRSQRAAETRTRMRGTLRKTPLGWQHPAGERACSDRESAGLPHAEKEQTHGHRGRRPCKSDAG